ncbi:hypothetical protein B484DRAFT_452727 [Ochromonadaceae sp. CCMP2298]|nr:hypothetical protein B484DRAFT_452727 [Ochromonadaceae sp. CCMP2298]
MEATCIVVRPPSFSLSLGICSTIAASTVCWYEDSSSDGHSERKCPLEALAMRSASRHEDPLRFSADRYTMLDAGTKEEDEVEPRAVGIEVGAAVGMEEEEPGVGVGAVWGTGGMGAEIEGGSSSTVAPTLLSPTPPTPPASLPCPLRLGLLLGLWPWLL